MSKIEAKDITESEWSEIGWAILLKISSNSAELMKLRALLQNTEPISVGSPLDISKKYYRAVEGEERITLINNEIEEIEERNKKLMDINSKVLEIGYSLIGIYNSFDDKGYKDRIQTAEENEKKAQILLKETKEKYEKKIHKMKKANAKFALKIKSFDPDFLTSENVL
jgi:hypothetical protein